MKIPTSSTSAAAAASLAAAAIGAISTSSLASAACISGSFYDDFESGSLNSTIWSLSGSGVGNWTVDSADPLQGIYSLKSPHLECVPGTCLLSAVAAIETCSDFPGGTLSARYHADVCDPPDLFRVDVEGTTRFLETNSTEGSLLVDLAAGINRVDFVYQFDAAVNRTCGGNVTGAVAVDEVSVSVDPDVPLSGTMDLWLVQEHFNVSLNDVRELENVTLAWLYDNVGAPGEFRPTAVRVDQFAFGTNDDDSVVVETMAFRLEVDFVAKQSYIDWVDAGQPDYLMDDLDEEGLNGGRQLQGLCRGEDKTRCCSADASNGADSSSFCRQRGCGRRRCGAGGDGGDGDGDRSGAEFDTVIAAETQNMSPTEVKFVLDAPDIDGVAFCAAMRVAFEEGGAPFPCDVYVDNQCQENEDRLFEEEEEVCTSAQPSLGPSLMPSVSSRPSSSPTFNPPMAVDDDVVVFLNEASDIDVLANDVSGLELFVVEITDGPEAMPVGDGSSGENIRKRMKRNMQQAERGFCEITGDSKFIRYTPNEGFLGMDSCGYRGR
ncbi:hypothetical protein ACHAXS_003096 [Conticribra weissflogii]